jgi:LAO/AO transport system kinase
VASRPLDLLDRARSGEAHAIARTLSILENDDAGAAELVRATHGDTGRATVIGVTGPPGGGKSTLVSALVGAYRTRGDRVAVVAVDPSSPFSGGAILGDRIRMRERFLDEGVFIRSMASRGHSGGLARASKRVVDMLDALGYAVVIVETVGVGQEEVDVVRVADTVCLVTVPGLGDGIQAIKAGVLEIADVIVVNKADRPGADETVRDLTLALSLGGDKAAWRPPIVRTNALSEEGIGDLVSAIAKHTEWARSSGEAERRATSAARAEIEALARDTLFRRLVSRLQPDRIDAAAVAIARRETDPYSAVEDLLS